MIKNLLQEGFALKNHGYYKNAIEIFYKALEKDNTSTELLFEIADLFYKMKNEEKALSYIEQILDKVPAHSDALKLLKQIFIDKKAYAEAEQTAKNIYCFSNNDSDLAEVLKLLNIQGKYDEVFEYNIETDSPQISLERAKAKFYKKDSESACKILQGAKEKNPNNIDILLLLGKVYYALNKKDECVKLLENISSEYENNADYLNFKGLVECYQGNHNKACQYIKNAIKIEPQNDEFYFNLANIYFKQGDTAFAKRYYNFAISLNQENKSYHFALANLYYSEKHYKRALEELQDDFFEAKLLKSIILYETGYLALARREFALLLEEQPYNALLLDYKSKIDTDLGIN